MTDITQAEREAGIVSDADRDLFIKLFGIPPSRAHVIYAGSRDASSEMQAIARHRLASTPDTPSEGERAGYKLVPVEPTEKMIQAGEQAAWDHDNHMPAIHAMRAAWSTMLSSAPSPTAEAQDHSSGVRKMVAAEGERESGETERLAQAMWASEDDPRSLDESGLRGTFERLAHAALSSPAAQRVERIEAAIHKRFPNADAQTVIALARDIVHQALGESAS